MSRYLLGVDPGKVHAGYCVLDVSNARPRWCSGGECSPAEVCAANDGVLSRYMALESTCRLVVIERPVVVHDAMKNANVIDCAWAGGGIASVAAHLGADVIEVWPATWHGWLVGKPPKGQTDKAVAARLPAMVADMPARTNAHARDACGVALYGWNVAQREGIGGLQW